jgi:hypothetical protein
VPFAQADIDALKRAIATGARKVRYESGGEVREVIYRDQTEMERALQMMEDEVSPSIAAPRVSVGRHNRF